MKQPEWPDKVEYPFASRYLGIGNHNLHYVDEGAGEALLFVHGTPSWSFDFRGVIKSLLPHFRCIALDHLGFGLSDKPSNYDYTLQNHIQNLELLVQFLELQNITLVLHDFGGPIGFAFAEKYPHLVKRLVVLNTWMWSFEQEPEFKKIKPVLGSPLLPFLYRYLNFSARFILPASFGEKKPDGKIRQHYTRPFANSKQRNGTIGFAHSLLRDQHFFEALWNNKNALLQKPFLFIWGMKDKTITPKYLKKFIDNFPNTRAVEISGAGHFPQEENPELVATEIAEFMKSPTLSEN